MFSEEHLDHLFEQYTGLKVQEIDVLGGEELKAFIRKHKLASYVLDSRAGESSDNLAGFAIGLRKLAARWPSLGLGLCMHAHIVYAFERYSGLIPSSVDMLNSVRTEQSLITSAFADGVIGSLVFDTALVGDDFTNQVIQLKGSKLPCTLGSIADFHCCSLKSGKTGEFSVAIIRNDADIECDTSFWNIDLFRSACTDKVNFDRKKIAIEELAAPESELMLPALGLGLTCFNYFAISCYLGVVDKLIEKVEFLVSPYGELATNIGRLKAFDMLVSPRLAELAFNADQNEQNGNEVMYHRYHLERLIKDLITSIYDSLSGLSFMTDAEFFHLLNIAQLLRYHPTSESKFLQMLLADPQKGAPK